MLSSRISLNRSCASLRSVFCFFTRLALISLTSLFHKKCNRLKARVVIDAYQVHVRLLSPESLVVKQPKFTRVEEPTLLCNQANSAESAKRDCVSAPSGDVHRAPLPAGGYHGNSRANRGVLRPYKTSSHASLIMTLHIKRIFLRL